MLTSFRKQKSILTFALWFVIIAFVITIFFVWGMGDKVASANYIMKVNGQNVTYNEYSAALENTRNYMRSIFGDDFDALPLDNELEKQVIEELVNKHLLIQQAKQNGITVSDDELLALVMSIPSFQIDGKFDQETYYTLISRNRMTPQQFEEGLRADRLAEKMGELISASVAVGEQEIKNEFMYRNEKASISYIAFLAENFASQVSVTDEEIQEFYNTNSEKYRIPKKIKLNYTYFDPATFVPASIVSDQDVENYYIRNKDQMTQEENITAKHILIRVEDWHNNTAVEAALKKTESVLKELKGGLDFSEAAKKYSADSSALNGGDLGTFSRGQMVPEFELAAFNLNKGELSEIVKTMYGFHIIKVTDKQEALNPTLEDVKEDIQKLLTAQVGESEFREYVYDKYSSIVRAANITAYNESAEKQLPVRETGFFTQEDIVAPMSDNPMVMNKLFRLSKSDVSQVETIDGVNYIFEVADVEESRIPSLDEVLAIVKADYISIESTKLAVEKAQAAMEEQDIKAAATKFGVNYVTTPEFIRIQQVPGIGMNLDLNDMVFSAGAGKFIATPFVNGSTVYAVFVNNIIEPDMEDFADYASMLKNEIFAIKSEEALSSYLETLREQAKIEISPFYENLFN